LTGPGGAGKTRLAGEVARHQGGQFADGVWLAELAAVRDPAQVAAAVAAALGIWMRRPVAFSSFSVNGLWASLGPGVPQTAYSTAKFAVRGFTEALIEDLRAHAPHVRAAVVLPGHVGTDIIRNSLRARGLPDPVQMTHAQLEELIPAPTRPEGAAPEELRKLFIDVSDGFRDKAPVSAAQAAGIILDGVQAGIWRILIGDDARLIDTFVRTNPDAAYDYDQLAKMAADRRTANAADAPTADAPTADAPTADAPTADGLTVGGSVPVTS
jgi:hypothetical protein